MPQIRFEGQTIEVSEDVFWTLLPGIAGSTWSVATVLCSGINGFPDVTGKLVKDNWRAPEGGYNYLQDAITQVGDETLRDLFKALLAQMEKMFELNELFVGVIADYLKLPLPQNQQDRRKLSQKMDRYSPVWIREAKYRQLAQQMQQIFEDIQKLKQQIDHRITQRRPPVEDLSENQRPSYPLTASNYMNIAQVEWGDQRAKDLIDEADGASDPQEAIKLLRKALRYGRTGLQASKAYQTLAESYEELHKPTLAINNYTKALAAGGPSASILFRRGRLYYTLNRRLEARGDLEQALARHMAASGDSLFSDEQELAEALLAALSKVPQES